MSPKKNTLKNLSVILCVVLLIAGVLLLSAALMQTEALISFESPALLSGTLPGFFIAGRFTSRKSQKEAAGCMGELFKPVVYLLFWPIYLLLWLISGKKK